MKKTKKGFTLLELVIVITVTALMMSIILVGLNSNKLDRELEAEADAVYAALRETQNYALTGREITPKCNVYELVFEGETGNYHIANESTESGISCDFKINYELQNGVTFTNDGIIKFTVPHGTHMEESNFGVRIIKNEKASSVCVSSRGVIEKVKGGDPCPTD